jgi:hypothetical protein
MRMYFLRFKLSEKFVNIYFSNPTGELLKLRYQLYDHCLRDRWIFLMKNGAENRHVESDGHFYGKRFSNLQELEDKINHSITEINFYSQKFNFPQMYIPLTAKIPMSIEFLNEAHGYFEKIDQYKKLRIFPEIKLALCNLNIAIHKAEQFTSLGEYDSDHVQVLMVPQVHKDLSEEDYQLFERDIYFGELYLSYGTTGVPTRDAFIHNTGMKPQDGYSSGMQLSFLEDLKFKFNNELSQWLTDKGLDPNDPHLAIGSIPLGKIVEPDISNREEFLNKLSKYQKVVSVEFEEELPAARWPYDNEIFYHLDYKPYLDLGITFDPSEMLTEARRALGYFVVHRDYDQVSNNENGKWKSLGLRALFSDFTKTQYHTNYEFTGDPDYGNTAFLDLCPHTKNFLNELTDLEKCERVRFMLLEPGAKIKVHRDSNERDTSLAVNISLNMPEGCEFWANLNSDASKNEHSCQLPFKNSGSVLLFNNAKYHYVENNSNEARIHIIFHGPIRFSDKDLIAKLRLQNDIGSKQEIVQKLIAKKSLLGECLNKTPSLFHDWVNSGLLPDSLSSNIKICIWDHEKYASDDRKKNALNHMTIPSIFPINYKVIKEKDINTEIQDAIKEGKTHLVLIAAGTLFTSLHKHLFYLTQFCQKMTEGMHAIAGQILDHAVEGQLPYFHEQYLIINLDEWQKNITENLGPLFTKDFFTFPDYQRSSEHYHDTYTPFWIAHGDEMGIRSGRAKWGTKVMSELIEKRKTILNIPAELRESKIYSYPRDTENKVWDEVQEKLFNQLQKAKDEVFVFNNEVLTIAFSEKLKPNTMISVAAGFKPFKIMNQYNLDKSSKIHFVDFSKKSLEYEKKITASTRLDELVDLANQYSRVGHTSETEKISLHHMNSLLRDYFDNSEDKLLGIINSAKEASFDYADLIGDNKFIANLLDEKSRFVIWISNVFYNNQIYYFMTKEVAYEVFLSTALAIASKMNTSAYLYLNTNTILFGKTINEPIGLMTDGAAQLLSLDLNHWKKI